LSQGRETRTIREPEVRKTINAPMNASFIGLKQRSEIDAKDARFSATT
jgi:hypothetical protein